MKKELNLRHRNIDGENDGMIATYLTNIQAFYIEAFGGNDRSTLSCLEILQVIKLRNFLNELDLGDISSPHAEYGNLSGEDVGWAIATLNAVGVDSAAKFDALIQPHGDTESLCSAADLYGSTPGCDGILIPQGSGVKCSKCPGWFCF